MERGSSGWQAYGCDEAAEGDLLLGACHFGCGSKIGSERLGRIVVKLLVGGGGLSIAVH